MSPRSHAAPFAMALAWFFLALPGSALTPDSDATAVSLDVNARKKRMPWIWQTPTRQTVPSPRSAHPSSDIDRFLLAKLEEAGIPPSEPADDRTWLRRIHFVLTGLPPSLDAIHRFLADPSPIRRERRVDALLASPHFGERWARHWMDLVRYAESRGHESDFPIPNAWQYRDYLIRAFNQDLPYPRFVSEHLAGDILPPRLDPATGANESVLATGWAFLGEEVHSPVDIRQDECERLDNKLDVLSKTFLGLTVACARCHDHKFDPITQRDYYSLAGFILGSSYRQVRFETDPAHARAAADLNTLRNQHRPEIAASVADNLASSLTQVPDLLLAALDARLGSSPDVTAPSRKLDASLVRAWLAQLAQADQSPSHPLRFFAQLHPTNAAPQNPTSISSGISTLPTNLHKVDRLALRGGLTPLAARAQLPLPGPWSECVSNSWKTLLPTNAQIIADFTEPGRTPWKTDGPAFGLRPLSAGEIILGTNLSHPIARILPYGAACRDVFWNRLTTTPGNESETGSHGATARSGKFLRTPTVTLTSGRVHFLLRGKARIYAGVDSHIMVAGPLHAALVTTLDGGQEPSWVTHNLSAYSGHRAHFEITPEGDGDLEILQIVEAPEKPATIAAPPWHPTQSATSTVDLANAFHADLRRALAALRADRLTQERSLAPLAAWIVAHPELLPSLAPPDSPTPATSRYLDALATLSRTIPWNSRTAVSWMDGTGVDERVLLRGKPNRPGEIAPRGLPTAFGTPPIRGSASSGRAELARQLTDPSNPLLARVYVNRLWQHVFGRGIVATPDNFGALGERPTHPELLDHLAWQFLHEDQGSTKRMLRRLVLTDAFARTHRVAHDRALEVDPGNTLLHRMPVRRLEGEAIRDAILTVSGRLDPRRFGPPVPVHLTEFIIGRGRPDRSGPLDGEGRRSLYTALPRNFLPSMMVAFDFPTPFSTVGRRNTTNVPGQPLVLMNDPFVHQQSRFWAGRVLQDLPGESDDTRIQAMFEAAYARLPSPEEQQACLDSLQDLRSLHAASGEEEAWTGLAHALLSANEFIYLR